MKMNSYRKKVNSWFFAILTTLIIIGLGFASGQYFPVLAAEGIVCNDYFINHKSIEPFYGQYKLDPSVLIHVREVVLAGAERTAPSRGKVLLFLHGFGAPGTVSFDLDHGNCSMMRYFAREGWDTFALDFEGHGLSTRPPLMDIPLAFPEAKAPIHSDVTINNVERVVDFISNLRSIKKVHLLGWSLGASREAPIYTIQNQDKVGKLVLYAPAYMDLGLTEADRKMAELLDTKVKIVPFGSYLEFWYRCGTKDEMIIPGALEAFTNAMLASDPKSGELGGTVRVPVGRRVDLLRAKPQFEAAKITVPTLIIRGAFDTLSTQTDSQFLIKELGSEVKQYVEIPNASHQIQYLKANTQFFKAIKNFLEAKIEAMR
jgi:pimeloyl-ACP methyl ester carboxylesterase